MQSKNIAASPVMTLTALVAFALASSSATAETTAQDRTLLHMIEARDALITKLQERVNRLENRLDSIVATPVAGRQAEVAAQPVARSSAVSARSDAPRAAAGSFEVDEDAAQRALERTLTQAGALLLPFHAIEVTPSLSYARREQDGPALVVLDAATSGLIGSNYLLGTQKTKRNEVSAHLDFKVGLPFDSQLEVGLPYGHIGQKQVIDLGIGLPGRFTSSDGADGMGDITLGMAKTFSREKGWQPDLIGRMTYNIGNGKRVDGNVNLGNGYRQLQAEVLALKRQDPLAFVASANYSKVFEKDSIKPGDAVGLSLAAILAASPSTSLQFGFSQTFRQKQEIGGLSIPGSEQAYGIMSLGASTALTRNMMLNTQLGVGMGSDAPRYNISVSLPIIF